MKVNDQRLALIQSYSDNAKEVQIAGLSSLIVAKFLQLEHRLELLVDLKIASELPSLLIKTTGQSASQQ